MMRGHYFLFNFFCCISLFCILSFSLRGINAGDHLAAAGGDDDDAVYIVYMGASASRNGSPRNDHSQLLNSLLKRGKNKVVHNYKNGFSGFAARLSKEEAESIAQNPGVISVFPDPILQLHTTRSWDFLNHQTDDPQVDDNNISWSSSSPPPAAAAASDSIIGILDTGIWPESESFNDKGMGPIPSRWKGTCMAGQDFTPSNCNKKLIGARYYNDTGETKTTNDYLGSPRDINGHGTHVASTAAGSPVGKASYYGLAAGTAKGGSPTSRIAMYRVCGPFGCSGSSILAAFEDAITDGVDVLSLSLGSTAIEEPDFVSDPIALGAFHAFDHGITVVCSAGNDGPDSETVVNVAPWILTVAASSIDRDFESNILLGGNKVIKGGGINFGNIQKSPVYPLISGSSAKSSAKDVTELEARNCSPGSLDEAKAKGRIILCENLDDDFGPKSKMEEVKARGGIGAILINDYGLNMASNYGDFPTSIITSNNGAEILSYLNSSSNPVATILATVSVTKVKPAPVVAYFSSRGPSLKTRNILKPDITGPGVAILAAWPANKTAESGKDPLLFNILSGTSMSCPHVSGVAASVKSENPSWTPSAVRSAIMTTASQTNNLKEPITTDDGSIATPYEYGAGELSTTGPLQPGLVYETEATDYLLFLCNYGYDEAKIKLMKSSIPAGFSCPKDSNTDLISSLNYPSIAISKLKENNAKTVTRTVTNVGEVETTYTVAVDVPAGLDVKVVPDKLQFTKNSKKLSYQVVFTSGKSLPTKDVFGSITWSNGKFKVRSPFVVSV